jgi:hypothetical protein
MAKITKTQINNVLKQVDRYYGVIKATGTNGLPKKISNCKGIKAGNISPMTATTAYKETNKKVRQKIIDLMTNNIHFSLNLISETESMIVFGMDNQEITFTLKPFPTYTYREEYTSYWWVLS